MSRASLPVLALVGLAACEPLPPQLPLACNDSYQSLVGSNIGAVTLPANLPHRIISPGMAVTEEFNADRLNVYVDDKGWIARVTCG